MSTIDHYQSDNLNCEIPDAGNMKFAIAVSEWNTHITGKLLEGALKGLKDHGAKPENIIVKHVPGSFELTFASHQLMKNTDADAIIALGCVIKGDTPHFDYVCMGVTKGITKLNAEGDKPVIFGLITTNNMAQAEERAGGRLGNKGEECAICAIKMIDLFWSLKK